MTGNEFLKCSRILRQRVQNVSLNWFRAIGIIQRVEE